MKKIIQIPALTAFAVGVLWTTGLPIRAEQAESLEELKAKLLELDQKVKILERNRELDTEASSEAAKTAPVITTGANGFTLRSGDTNFALTFHGVVQADNRTFFDDGGINGNDGFLLRKARPILQGTVFKDFDFLFVSDFGGSAVQILDANLNYRYAPWLQLRAGKFKTPVGLEQLQGDPYTLFNERSLVTDLVPNRDVGFQLWGDIADATLSYAAGVFNGVGDARSSGNIDFEDHREFAGRLFVQPFKKTKIAALQGLGFGVGGSYGKSATATGLPGTTGGTLPGFATDGQQQFFAYNPTNGAVVADGTHWRVSPQVYYHYGPFGLMGEYAISDQRVSRTAAPLTSANLRNTAWEVTGSWVLTGEDASFSGVTPRQNFDLRAGHWGAFEVLGRYASLDIDNAAFPLYANTATSASAAHSWSAGLNWYLNRNVRVAASFSRTTFSGGGGAGTTAPAIVTRQPENVFFTRLQLAF